MARIQEPQREHSSRVHEIIDFVANEKSFDTLTEQDTKVMRTERRGPDSNRDTLAGPAN